MSNISESIVLSSDEETENVVISDEGSPARKEDTSDEESPPKKKLKSLMGKMGKFKEITLTPSFVISDDEDDSDVEFHDVKENSNITDSNIEENNKTNMEHSENEDTESVSEKNTEQIIDISENSDENEIDSCIVIDVDNREVKKPLKNNFEKNNDKNTELSNINVIIDDDEQVANNTEKTCEENNKVSKVDLETDEPLENDTEPNTHSNNKSSNIGIDIDKPSCTEINANENNQLNIDGEVDDEASSKHEETNTNENNDENIQLARITAIVEEPVRTNTETNINDNSKLTCSDLIEEFLELCNKMLENTEYNLSKQSDILKQYYKKCELKLKDCPDFRKLVEKNIKRAKLSSDQAVISFGEVIMHVKDLVEVNTVEVSKKKKMRLKKLEHTIRLLVKKIKELEEAEIDFSDEEDSSYLMIERYINRLNKVYHKYCEYMKSNPYAGRITFSKLNFVDSKYNELNRAISKNYKDNKKFPSYFEMENFIKKVLEKNQMELSETEIKSESLHCFKKLGELLQTRRRRELYETHYMYVEDNAEDPAKNDSSLRTVLETNFKSAQTKIDQLCREYVDKQEQGGEANEIETDGTESNDDEENT